MSHLSYGMSVYMPSNIKLKEEDPTNKHLKQLLVKQNDAMRIILNKRRKDLTPKDVLLKECGMRSINQQAAETVLMELWRAFRFDIDSITNAYEANKGTRHGHILRTSCNPSSIVSVSAKLWNSQCYDFKSIKMSYNSAKRNAQRMIAKSIPSFWFYIYTV